MNILLLGALAVLILGFLMVTRKNSRSTSAATRARGSRSHSPGQSDLARSSFAAVSIACAENACAPVRELEGQRFLEREAPITPLAGCSCSRCECRYIHHSDRRGQEDRRDPLGTEARPSEFRGALDRRSNSERRKDTSTANPTDTGYKELLREAIKEEVGVGQRRPQG
jgi:hypothetical protein